MNQKNHTNSLKPPQAKRTHYCGHLNAEHIAQEVTLMGWVDGLRDHGGVLFVDLRDRMGVVQVVIDPEARTAEFDAVRSEAVIGVRGEVRARPGGAANAELATGAIEIKAATAWVITLAKTPPFQIDDEKVSENLRLKYRYLDLRSRRLQKYLTLRHQVMQATRNFLSSEQFLEIETPILYKSTPEGARDYLVPSRVNKGSFYALPQSPQTLKQLLMVAGMDRYFQVARCFRDEDLRADRQPEFSQIDIEMSFVDAEDVMALTNALLKYLFHTVLGFQIDAVPVMSFEEAMGSYGSDKPDLRIPWRLQLLNSLFQTDDQLKQNQFEVFKKCIDSGGEIRGFMVPAAHELSRAQIDKLLDLVKNFGAKGLIWIKYDGHQYQSPINKFFDQESLAKLYQQLSANGAQVEKGLALIIADEAAVTRVSLGQLRSHLGAQFLKLDPLDFRFCWITDFPLIEYSAEHKRWMACHHPFTAPQDAEQLLAARSDTRLRMSLKAKAYDLACNGYELAGGSIRIHDPNVQAAMFETLGLTPQEVEHKFGFFVEALQYGTPPHGGIAWGLDRLVMLMCGTDAIRDVIAFPKTAKATDLMADAPSTVDREQLVELGLTVTTS